MCVCARAHACAVCTVKVSFSSPCPVQSAGHVQSTSLPALDSSGRLCSPTQWQETPSSRPHLGAVVSSLCLLGLQFPIIPRHFKMLSLAPVSNVRLTRIPVFALCMLSIFPGGEYVCLCTETRGWHRVSSWITLPYMFQRKVSQWPWNSPIWLAWLTSELRRSSCLCLPSSGRTEHSPPHWVFWKTCILGAELRSSCLHGKHTPPCRHT